MATTEAGHIANRCYIDRDGAFHLNGGTIYTDEVGTTAFSSGTLGAVNGATVSAAESAQALRRTVLTLAATPVTVSDTSVGGGVKIYDFPEGRIVILGALGSLAFTTTSTLASTLNAGVTINWGVGSVITTTQASGTLTTTECDIIASTNATSSATINVAGAVSNGVLAAAKFLDGTTTAIDANLNIGVAGATDIDGDATVTVAGTITLVWLLLGDY